MRRIANGESQIAEAIATEFNLQQRNFLTTAFWLAYLLEGLAACDLVIDTERMEVSEDYRCEIASTTQGLFEAERFKDFRRSRLTCDYAPPAAIREIVGASARLQRLARSLKSDAVQSLGEDSRRVLDVAL